MHVAVKLFFSAMKPYIRVEYVQYMNMQDKRSYKKPSNVQTPIYTYYLSYFLRYKSSNVPSVITAVFL